MSNYITAVEAHDLSLLNQKLCSQDISEVNKICHSVRLAASKGESKIVYVVARNTSTLVVEKLRGLGFNCRKAIFYFKLKTVKLVVRW